MILKNSGKLFQFKLEHDLGYGFAEQYDFSDRSTFDGLSAYVYNLVVKTPKEKYTLEEFRNSGIALGPITLWKYPNVRGTGAWKFLFQTDDLLITKEPPYKSLRALIVKDNNWDNLNPWFKYSNETNFESLDFVPYKEIRGLEQRVMHLPTRMVTKFTMKNLIDKGMQVSEYYDLANEANKFTFLELINTYYPLTKTKLLLTDIPVAKK